MEQGEKKRLLLITAVALGLMLNPLNTSMISVALSRLQEQFQLSFTDISWLIATYYLASAIGQPVMGKLSDVFGRKRIFLIGLLFVAASSSLAPLSPGFGWLLAFRVVQSFGTSALFPSGMGIIRSSITSNQARVLGVLSICSNTSAAFGPSIGGFLIHYGDWPSIFLINFPVIVISFLLALKVMPADLKQKETHIKLDIWGIVLFSLLIFVWLLFFLSFSKGGSWWLLGVGIVVGFMFHWFENRQAQPFIDVQFLRNNINITLIYVKACLVNIIFYSIMFGIPLYLQNVRHFDTQKTGLIMLSIAGFAVFIVLLLARWLDKYGSKYPLLFGTLTIIIGTLLLTTIQDDSGTIWIFTVLSILGMSIGIISLSLQIALYSFISTKETGIASGLFMTSRFIGTILSSSLLGILFGKEMVTSQLHWMGIICAVIGGLMLVLTFRFKSVD